MAYARVKIKWHFPTGVEIVGEKSDESPYAPSEVKTVTAVANDAVTGVRRAQLVFSRSSDVVGQTEDVAVMHLDYMNFTAGEPDNTWDTTDFTTVESAIVTAWDSWKLHMSSTIQFAQIRWYRIGPRISPPNPPVRITNYTGKLGTGGDQLPPQCAITATFKHPVRLCWGRCYLPEVAVNALESSGRVKDAVCQVLGDGFRYAIAGGQSRGIEGVVYSRTRAKTFNIESVQVDDLFDTQRRRRYDRPDTKYQVAV